MKIQHTWRKNDLPMMIAEIGGNHEGNFNKALELLELAIESGVHCIKFQLYSGDTLVNRKLSPSRNLHFKKFELSKEQHIKLAKICFDNNVIYNASVWDLDMLNWIDEYLLFYKIGSGDLTAYPILKEFALRGKPIILSTGLANEQEVLDSIDFIQSVNSTYKNPSMLCVMQCTSMYPISKSFTHLKTLNRFREITNLSVGYSDHTIGDDALKIAAAMGADVLEFHFTDTRLGKDFRDHKVSLTKDEVINLRKEIKEINILMGESVKKLQKIEIDNNHHISFRRGAYLRREIKKGDIIKANDLVFLRPLEGTCASNFQKIIGATAIKDIKSLTPIEINVDFR